MWKLEALGSYIFDYIPVEWSCETAAMKLAFEFDVPDGAIDRRAEAELVRSVREQAALKLYADGRVTTGEAAGILGLTRIQFLDLLRRSGVGFQAELDDDDFAQLRQRRGELTGPGNR